MQTSGKFASRAGATRFRAQVRQVGGFTLIEIMVVVTIIGILAATAMSNFIKVQEKSKRAAIIDNMHTVQVAAEAYATDTSGIYAPTPNAVEPYLPGGGNSQGGAAGRFPTNPITL